MNKIDKRTLNFKTQKTTTIDQTDMDKINALALEPLTEDDVFVFKAMIATNEDDDRNYEPFSAKAIEDMANLYVGKPVIVDHVLSANGQIGRIFDAWVETDMNKMTAAGEPHAELHIKAYMLNSSPATADVKSGIKRELSTDTIPERLVCSVCGADNTKGWCEHWPGQAYGDQTCKMTIDGVRDVAELSFVAFPAQPDASTHKSVTDTSKTEQEPLIEAVKLAIKMADAWAFCQKNC